VPQFKQLHSVKSILATLGFTFAFGVLHVSIQSPVSQANCQDCTQVFPVEMNKLQEMLKKNEEYKTRNTNLSDSALRKVNSNITIIILRIDTLKLKQAACSSCPTG